ncbi:MAG: glycosyltransferase [Actinobacteria bacterium]|nr:glycosyltransferase [Actinomycetota bacterium]
MTSPATLRPVPAPGASPPPVRVLYLIDSLGPGGAEHLLAASLPFLRRAGVVPEVVALQEQAGNPIAARISAQGVPVRQLGIRRLRQRGARRRVREAIIAAAPDVVHTQLEFAAVLGIPAARRLGLPTVATLHTLDAPPPRSRLALHFRLMAWSLRRARRVVAVSEATRRHYLEQARLRPERVATIYNGIDPTTFRSSPEDRGAARHEFGLGPDAPVLITVAVLREPKGLQHMLAALPRVAAAFPAVRYLVVGDGPHRAALEAATRNLSLEDRVVFAGARHDVPRLLAAADVFVLPSLTEALPTVLAEAMAAGLPIVATTVGGIPEMVRHGDAALLVPPADDVALADAVCRLLANPRQAAAMGRSGRRLVAARFDIRAQAQALADDYRALAAKGRP